MDKRRPTALTNFSSGSAYTAELTMSDACSSKIVWRKAIKTVDGFSVFMTFPNPANNKLTVLQNESVATTSKASVTTLASSTEKGQLPFAVKLFDQNGQERKTASSTGGKTIELSLAGLPNGTYFLHIFQGKEVIKKQIVVQH